MSPSAVVTGAAAGIGRATVATLLDAGYRVGAFDIDLAGLESLAAEQRAGDRLVTGRLDVRDPEEWAQRLADFTAPVGGRLEVLVNNAGVLVAGRFEEIDLAAQRRTVDINVSGVLTGCHVAHPYLTRAASSSGSGDPGDPGAVVVNLCSASAIYGQAELATYSASKFAVRGLTEALDLEWDDQGIRVRALWPLFVDTAMVDGVDIGTTRSLGVHLTPIEVAAAVREVVEESRTRLPRGVHRPVGRQARALFAAAGVSPGWMVRGINRRLSARSAASPRDPRP